MKYKYIIWCNDEMGFVADSTKNNRLWTLDINNVQFFSSVEMANEHISQYLIINDYTILQVISEI